MGFFNRDKDKYNLQVPVIPESRSKEVNVEKTKSKFDLVNSFRNNVKDEVKEKSPFLKSKEVAENIFEDLDNPKLNYDEKNKYINNVEAMIGSKLNSVDKETIINILTAKILHLKFNLRGEQKLNANVTRSNGDVDNNWVVDKGASNYTMERGKILVLNIENPIKKEIFISDFEKVNSHLFKVKVTRSDGSKEHDWNIRQFISKDDGLYIQVTDASKQIQKTIKYEKFILDNPQLKEMIQ